MGVPSESKDLGAVETAPARSDEQTETHLTHPHYRATYAIMFGFLLLGLLAAVGHHRLYLYLDTLEIDGALLPQKWVIRVGNTLAFLTCRGYRNTILRDSGTSSDSNRAH